jgi:hypothetical protein
MGTPELSVMAARRTSQTTAVSRKLDEISSRLAALEKGQHSLRKSLDRKLASLVPVASSKADGPVAPEHFRLEPKEYGPFTPLQWRLLACLWGKDALEVGEALEALYGHDHEQDQNALRLVVRRLNRKLRKQSFPGRVEMRKGYAWLQWSGIGQD